MSTLFPAMKLKRGEIEALRQSERAVLEAITPIFDIARPSSKTSIEKRLADSLDLLHHGWPRISKEFYLDMRDLPLDCRLANGAHPLYYFGRQLALHSHNVTHCFGFDRDDAYEEALTRLLIENSSTNIALRIEQQDMKLLDTTEELTKAVLQRFKRTVQSTTVFLDLQSIYGTTDELAQLITRSYARFEKLGARKIVFLASAMWDYSRIKPEQITEVPRIDIALWEQLRRQGLDIRYGDYGVVAPSFIDPEKIVIPAPKFRYCTPSKWLVAKGEKPRKDENSQYPRLAKRLTNRPEFRANDLGWGHDQIRDFASYALTRADHARAVAIDTCSHLDITVKQVLFAERQIAQLLESPVQKVN